MDCPLSRIASRGTLRRERAGGRWSYPHETARNPKMLLAEGNEAGDARAKAMRSEASDLVRRHGIGDVHAQL
jgi:hypothetical protein